MFRKAAECSRLNVRQAAQMFKAYLSESRAWIQQFESFSASYAATSYLLALKSSATPLTNVNKGFGEGSASHCKKTNCVITMLQFRSKWVR